MQTRSKTYTRNGRRYRYRYRAVTAAGVGIHSVDYVNMRAAQRKVEGIKATWPSAELQRVREFLAGTTSRAPDLEIVEGRQYELIRCGKWVPESRADPLPTGDSK